MKFSEIAGETGAKAHRLARKIKQAREEKEHYEGLHKERQRRIQFSRDEAGKDLKDLLKMGEPVEEIVASISADGQETSIQIETEATVDAAAKAEKKAKREAAMEAAMEAATE